MSILKIKKPKQVIIKIMILMIYIVLVALFQLFSIPCLWQLFFHIPCPGCGMTRGLITFFQGNFLKAFQYHLCFWSAPLLFLYFIFDGCLFGKKWDRIIFISLGILFFVNWIIHLINGFS